MKMRHHIAVVLLAAAALCPNVASAHAPSWFMERYRAVGHHDPKWDHLVSQAVARWEREEFADAAKLAHQALEKGCDCPIVKLIYAWNACWIRIDDAEVTKTIKESIAACGDRHEFQLIKKRALYVLALQCQHNGNDSKALAVVKEAEAVQPDEKCDVLEQDLNGIREPITAGYAHGTDWYVGRYREIGRRGAKWDALVEQAGVQWGRGQFAEAAKLAHQALEAGCDCPVVKLIYAWNACWAGIDGDEVKKKVQESIAACGDAREFQLIKKRGLFVLACQYMNDEKYEPAQGAIAQAEAIETDERCTYMTQDLQACRKRLADEAGRDPQSKAALEQRDRITAFLRQFKDNPTAELARQIRRGYFNDLKGYPQQAAWLETALPLSKEIIAQWPENPQVLRIHHFVLTGLKRWKEAEEFGVKAIAIIEKTGDRETLFRILSEQAWLVYSDSHADRTPEHNATLEKYNAIGITERLVSLAEELDNDELRYLALDAQGQIIGHFQGKWRKSVDLFTRALSVAEKNHWQDRAKQSKIALAMSYACMGDQEESVAWSNSAGAPPHPFVNILRKDWQKIYSDRKPGIAQYERLSLRQPNERLQRDLVGWEQRLTYDDFITACMKLNKPEEAIEATERLHNRTLGMILGARFEEGVAAVTAQKKQTQEELRKKVDTLKGQLVAARRKSDDGQIESIQRDLKVQSVALEQLAGDVAADELEIKAAQSPPRMSVKEMQALLDSNTCLVMYYVNWGVSYTQGFAATVTNNEAHCSMQEGLIIGSDKGYGIQTHVESYMQALLNPHPTAATGNDLRKRNDDLYAMLIAPIEAQIKDKRHLIIVPSGPLCQFPIHLLRGPDGRFLFESHSISYVPSVGVLKYALARNRKVGGEVTVVANPALAMQGASLKFAETEAQAIAQVYPKANLLVGDRATETAVRTALATADVLHFACHGLLDTDYPMKSALALTPDDQNDGMLTAREICDYPVKAGLVVLSACQSGSGGMSAGWIELVGMSRAWLLAGAPSVMVSLWKLDDRATSELMAEFYGNLRTMGRAEALQRAQITMMKKYDNPYYWGAFVLYGDYR